MLSKLLLNTMDKWTKLACPHLSTSQMHSTSSKAEHALHVLASTADHSYAAAHT